MNRVQSPGLPSVVLFCCTSLVLCFLFLTAPRAFAGGPRETVLHTFLNGATTSTEGDSPRGALVADEGGNLFGANLDGGGSTCFCGTIFELSPPISAGGEWTETTLYSFRGGASDGSRPIGGLIRDGSSNLYGTTAAGGPHDKGTIFELSPPSEPGGTWTETVLWEFDPVGGVARGYLPSGNLVMDELGNLYGTTSYGGGSCVCGVVFELVAPRTVNPHWEEKVLYKFETKGTGPRNLLLRNGVLYGSTAGNYARAPFGTVYEVALQSGVWQETTLYTFTGETDGSNPGPLLRDTDGNLFGITGGINSSCGTHQICGTIFELSPPSSEGGSWQITTLYTFAPGLSPITISRDSDGVFYGATTGSGDRKTDDSFGTLFKLAPPATSGGAWVQTALHLFGALDGDGAYPSGDLLHISGRGFYGNTESGGNGGVVSQGTVYNFMP